MARRRTKLTIGFGGSAVGSLLPFMLNQFGIQQPILGWIALVVVFGLVAYGILNLPLRRTTIGRLLIGQVLGFVLFGFWLHFHYQLQRTQQTVTPQSTPEIAQHSEGQQSPSIAGNQNSVVAHQTTGDYSPVIAGNNNQVFYGKTTAQEQQERVERQQTIVQEIEMIRAHIFLAEKYGGEWQGTNDEEIRFWRREEQRDVLRKPYNPNLPENPHEWPRFTPEVCHAVRGLVIPRATIYLKIPKDIIVESLPGHVEPSPAQRWTPVDGHHYYTLVGQATETLCSGVIQSLALKFPGPDTYPVEYILSLPINGLGDIRGTVYFEIVDAD